MYYGFIRLVQRILTVAIIQNTSLVYLFIYSFIHQSTSTNYNKTFSNYSAVWTDGQRRFLFMTLTWLMDRVGDDQLFSGSISA